MRPPGRTIGGGPMGEQSDELVPFPEDHQGLRLADVKLRLACREIRAKDRHREIERAQTRDIMVILSSYYPQIFRPNR